jgi:hypothetical protein
MFETKSKRPISRRGNIPDVQLGAHAILIPAGNLTPVSGFSQALYASYIFATDSIIQILLKMSDHNYPVFTES